MALVERSLLASPTVEDVVEQVSAALRAVWQAQVDASRMAEQQAAAERAALHAYLNNQNAAAHLGTGVSAVVTNGTVDAEAHGDWGYRGGEDRGRWGSTNRNAVSEHAQGSDTTSDVSINDTGSSMRERAPEADLQNNRSMESHRPSGAPSETGPLQGASTGVEPGTVGSGVTPQGFSRGQSDDNRTRASSRPLFEVRGPTSVQNQVRAALAAIGTTIVGKRLLNALQGYYGGEKPSLLIEARNAAGPGFDQGSIYTLLDSVVVVPALGLDPITAIGMATGQAEVLDPDLLLFHELVHALADAVDVPDFLDIPATLNKVSAGTEEAGGLRHRLSIALRDRYGGDPYAIREFAAIAGLDRFGVEEIFRGISENAYRKETGRLPTSEYRFGASFANESTTAEFAALDAFNSNAFRDGVP